MQPFALDLRNWLAYHEFIKVKTVKTCLKWLVNAMTINIYD